MKIHIEGRVSYKGQEYGTYIDVTEETSPGRLRAYRELIELCLTQTVDSLRQQQETM